MNQSNNKTWKLTQEKYAIHTNSPKLQTNSKLIDYSRLQLELTQIVQTSEESKPKKTLNEDDLRWKMTSKRSNLNILATNDWILHKF